MTTSLSRIMTNLEALLPIIIPDPLVMLFCNKTRQNKTIQPKNPIHVVTWPFNHLIKLQRTRRHQTRQCIDLLLETPTIESPCHVTNDRSCDNLKNLYFHVMRLMATKLSRLLAFRRRLSTQTLKSPPTSCSKISLLFFPLLLTKIR